MVAAFQLTIIRPHATEVCDLDHTNRVVTEFVPRLPDTGRRQELPHASPVQLLDPVGRISPPAMVNARRAQGIRNCALRTYVAPRTPPTFDPPTE